MKSTESDGFTLIELLVVVVIIGILAAIAIPAFLLQREAAWKSSVESDLKNTSLFVELWAVDHKGLVTGADTGVVPTATGANVVTIAVVGQTYTICGFSPELSQSLTYDSLQGGVANASFEASAC